MLTIGLIDNFVITRLGLTILLNDHFQQIKLLEANNIKEFETIHNGQTPELIILGNNFPYDDQCLAAARQLKKYYPDIPLVVYDEHLMENLTAQYFRIGISGYVLRQNTAEEMVNCIEAIRSKKRFLCPVLTQQLLTSLSRTAAENQETRKTVLTRRETEIANYIGQGMKTSYISAMLGRTPSTISSIKHNIFKKLNVKNVIELREAFPEYHPLG